MDPVTALEEILRQIVELGGAGLDLISQAAGGNGGAPAPADGGGGGEAPPAPPQ
jgi:hypothetical protein